MIYDSKLKSNYWAYYLCCNFGQITSITVPELKINFIYNKKQNTIETSRNRKPPKIQMFSLTFENTPKCTG